LAQPPPKRTERQDGETAHGNYPNDDENDDGRPRFLRLQATTTNCRI
jgi:hypothetical protein